ncbi:transient receptor potential cation channel subfamily A member 1-like [Montipora capricornis]|uniref:transient receptor potential cation channel subfamily A member 1-like n=1 Tax=Montipora capricornis TaxID=246305 RepID=UPI0035F12DAD
MRKALGRLGNALSQEDQANGQVKRRYNPFRHRTDEKDVPLVNFEPQSTKVTKPGPSVGLPEESSEVVTSVSPHCLRLFEAVREDEMDLVKEELASLTDKSQIDRLSGHGFALIHVAARYNFGRIVDALLDQGAEINIGTREYRWTPLHLACRFNCLSTVVDVLLPRGADPRLRGKNGSMSIHLAARKGNEEIIKVLLDQPTVQVDAKDGSGKTALHLACSEGHVKICQILLNYGADITTVSEEKMTPILCAIQNCHTEIARMILNRASERDANTNKEEILRDEDLHSNTALHLAVLNLNDVKTVELCLDSGADVNILTSNSVTPLHLAASKGNIEVADFLISRGANVHIKDGDSKTPLHMAAIFNQTRLIEFLLEREAKLDVRDSEGRTPFLNAVAAGQVESARLLLNHGADISATDLLMKTCVHIAVEYEHFNTLDMLLDRRSGVNNLSKGDVFDRVPIHYAATTKDIKILELVLSKQKRHGIFFQDEHHKTPLHLAAEMGSSKHVEALAKHTRKMNARDEKGRTPLHSAARKGQRKSCLALLTIGADVNSRDNNHRTPLMWAANNNQLKCVEVLLEFKASPDLQDAHGNSALLLACAQGHGAIVNLLMDHGASLTLNNNQDFDCLELAAKAGSSNVAMAIVKHKRWIELENYKTSNGQTAISLLIENFPEAAEVVLNQCVHHSEHLNPSDPEYAVTYNFKYLDQDPATNSPEGRFSAVKTMIKYQRERLLLHPLTLKLNERKWVTLGRAVFMIDFMTYLMLMIFFTIFIVDERSIQNFRPANNSDGGIPKQRLRPSDIYKLETAFAEIVPPLILLFSIIHICKEFLQIYVQRCSYFKDFSNYLDWILYGSTLVFMVPYVMSPARLDEWLENMKDPRTLWFAGILAIFVCYTNMMLFLRRYRLFGTYISMYVEVTQTVVQVMGVFIFLVLGFALVFYILFKEQIGFHTVHHSLLRVLVMMIGELDYGAIFIDSINERNQQNQNLLNPFPPVAFLFLYTCLISLSVALMNLLVGLAVGDTETMKKCATIKRLEMQLQYQFEIEEGYPNFLTRRAYETVYVEKPNNLRNNRLIEWLQERFSETSPAPVQDSEPSELNELKAETTKNTKRIKSMMTMLEAQSKLLRTLAKTIDPKFELLNDAGDISRVDNTDGVLEKSLEAGKGFGSFGSAITEPNI